MMRTIYEMERYIKDRQAERLQEAKMERLQRQARRPGTQQPRLNLLQAAKKLFRKQTAVSPQQTGSEASASLKTCEA